MLLSSPEPGWGSGTTWTISRWLEGTREQAVSHQTQSTPQREDQSVHFRPGSARGFTLVEMLFVTIVMGLLMALGVPKAQQIIERARVAKAIGDINAIQTDIDAFGASNDTLPTSLASIGRGSLDDPWGRPYQYLRFPPPNGNGNGGGPPAGARRDRFLVPINSTYDLYSVGKDGNTSAPLTANASHDDVVRANDGGFIGLGRLY